MMQFDTIQSFGKDNLDATMRSFGAISKGVQTAAVETAEYTKRSFEHGSSVMEKFAGIRTLDKAMEAQADFLRSSYEGFVSQASKMGEIATSTAKDAFAPMEGLVAKATKTA